MSQAAILSRPDAGLRWLALVARERAAGLWRAYPRETLGAGLLALVTGLTIALSPASDAPPLPAASPPAPPPLIMRAIAPEQAVKVNAEIPLTGGPNPAAQPFRFTGNAAARNQALECLASTVYYEAGSESDDGQRAVAQVVLNRVRHAAFPGSVCGVAYQGSTRPTGCQFTYTCDGSLYRQPSADGWKRAYRVAQAALAGYVFAPVGLATHYHADYVVPYWASTLAKNAVVGAHIFYRWPGGWGQPAAFVKTYSGREPSAAALRSAALAAPHVTALNAGSVAAAVEKIPGAEEIKLAPSMRGDKRVAVRFTLAARKASEEAPHEEYTKKFAASDNLAWSLSSGSVASNQTPLGKAPTAPTIGRPAVPPTSPPQAGQR